MGGSAVRYEPANLDTLLLHPEAYQIFLQAGWIPYFKKLQGFNEDEVLEFSQNLTKEYSMVNGVRIPVSEESIVAVTGLPTTGDRWFNRKIHLLDAQKDFLVNNEQIRTKGRGADVNSLPEPWGKVAEFVKRYITCEGRYQVVYFSDFILLSHLRHQKFINIPYYLLHSLNNMAHFVKKSKNPKNCLSNHRLIGLLIRNGMDISNNPLPVVADQPPSIPTDMPGPLPESLPSAATTVQTPTVAARKTTQRSKRTIRGHPSTNQTSLDEGELTQPVAVIVQNAEQPAITPSRASQPLAATDVIEKLPPAPKQRTPVPVSALPRKRTRSERSTAAASLTTPVAPAETPIVSTTVPSPTITAGRISQKRKRPFKGKCRKDLDPIISATTQNPSAVVTENSTEIHIPGFNLCPELQATIVSLQTECTPIAAESSAPPDDSVDHTSNNDVQIIADPGIPEFPTCVVEEEQPVPPPSTKKKASAFVSILPRRKTRSTSFAEATIGWKAMEQAIPVLHPLSTTIDEETVTQEPVSSSNLTVLVKTPANNGTGIQGQVRQDEAVTQEPTIQDEPVPQEET
jgi:hypothetical protein